MSPKLCQDVRRLRMHLDPKQNFLKANLYSVHACKCCLRTKNTPDLTAVAQDGLHQSVKQFAFQDRVMDAELLTSMLQPKHGSFGSLTEMFYCGA